MDSPFLIAHRGIPAQAPENSARGFQLARRLGATAVELDLRLTADSFLVVLHDDSPKRLTGDKRRAADRPARDLVNLRYLEDPGEHLLLLDEALALLPPPTLINLELKADPDTRHELLLKSLFTALEAAGSPRNLIVSSEDPALVHSVGTQAPLLRTGLIYRFTNPRDAIDLARECSASVLAANARRVSSALLRRAREADLAVWAYTVNDPLRAAKLFEKGCEAVFTDDYPRLAAALEASGMLPNPEPPPRPVQGTRRGPQSMILAIDLGSSSTKLALVDPQEGIVARASAATPVSHPAPGRVEHDPEALLRTLRELLAELAKEQPEAPRAAAIASQRSTGLWAEGDGLTPLSPAVSWQDERGAELVGALEARRAELETEAGLPLTAAWTAVLGRSLLGERAASRGQLLLALGSWIAARLTAAAPRVDPTLANRSFLLRADASDWSPLLLEAFDIPREALPALTPSVGEHGTIPWPGGGQVPLHCLVGDQQAAYVGAAGPMGTRLVLNVGTAGFAMRLAGRHERASPGSRRAPLWTSTARPKALAFLREYPVIPAPEARLVAQSPVEASRESARRLALGEPGPVEFIRRLGEAVSALLTQRHRSVLLAGGILESPHLLHRLEQTLPLPGVRAREKELTLLGAARLAAAGIGLPWSVPEAGGVAEDRHLWL